MSDTSIQHVVPSGVPVAANYQTFEMAKANNVILGGDNIAQIRSYAAYARAQAQAIHKTIAATNGITDVAAIKAEANETAQTFAKVSVYADERIGEILRGIEQAKRGPKVNSGTQEKTKAEAIKEAGISKSQAYDLQAMADNPEVVEAVIAKAEAEGRIVSRKQVLDAIDAQKRAEEERDLLKAQRDAAIKSFEEVAQSSELLETEAQSLRRQLAERPQPEVIEREVVSEEAQRRIHELEHLERLHSDDNQKLRRHLEETRKELDRAKGILGMDSSTRNVQRDVEYLITATNQYVRNYGGLTWTFERIAEVDEITRNKLRKAVKNLATFSSALMAGLEQM